MRILVTGGAGFIGSHYVRTLISGGYPGFTDEVYGSVARGSWSEDAPLAPNSPYAAAKAGGDLGYAPRTPFPEGLRATVQWYRDYRSWWEPLKLPSREPGRHREARAVSPLGAP